MQTADRLITEGNRAENEGRLQEACRHYRAAVEAAPEYAPAHLNLGIGLESLGDPECALSSYERAYALDPANPFVNYNLGRLIYTRGNLERAEVLLRAALDVRSEFAEANLLLSNVYDALGKLADAAAQLEAALKHRPGHVRALLNYAAVLQKMRRSDDAEAALRRALFSDPLDANTLEALGNFLTMHGRLTEAAGCYEKALAVQPESAAAHWRLGNILADQNRPRAAVARYRRAIALDSGFADAYFSLAHVLGGQHKLNEAEACLLNLLELKPDLVGAHLRLGHIHRARDRMDEALRCYERARALDPDGVEPRWCIAMSHIHAVFDSQAAAESSRDTFARKLDELDRWIGPTRLGPSVDIVGNPSPFYLAYQEQNNRELLQCHGLLCSRIMESWRKTQPAPPPTRAPRLKIIRVGVVSAYFHNHSVWNALTKGWFEQLDRSKFAIEAFHLGSESDKETQIARSAAAHFEQEHGTLHRWAATIAMRQPDILIYPEVGMDHLTLKLASMRFAPVQLASWGHPETTGLPTIDYFLSAEDLEPARGEENYSERLIRLPHLGCSYASRQIAPAPAALGERKLDGSVPTLVCPGTPFKYAPQNDSVLVEIACRLGDCRFLFFAHRVPELSGKLRNRLRGAFAKQGLDADKFLVFAPWQTPAQFRGVMGMADVFLDSIGFSGFNTAMEAVECALPIVTREGRFMRGRFASGILKRMGLWELVAPSDAAYVDLAVRICTDAPYRAGLRRRIEAQRGILFDDPAPVRALEEFLLRVATR